MIISQMIALGLLPGSGGTVVAGPYCVQAVQVHVAGAIAAEVFVSGVKAAQVHVAGARAVQVECE